MYIAGDVHLTWRPAGSGIDFANDVVLVGLSGPKLPMRVVQPQAARLKPSFSR
jgi:hypothetical protein